MRGDYSHRCPLCREVQPVILTEEASEYRFWRCTCCDLVFADPLEYSAEAYDEGYGTTDSPLNEMAEYSRHLQSIETLNKAPDLTPYLTPLEVRALRMINARLQRGAPILDIGCGAGRFLMALHRCGYDARGLEVAAMPVRALQCLGLSVRQGTLDEFPTGWPEPAAIVCFEVLEHLPDPLGFVMALRHRFPRALLLLAVPYSGSRSRRDVKFRKGDAPPNHLTRWTPAAFDTLLSKGGYTAAVEVVHVTADHLPLADNPMVRIARQGEATTVSVKGSPGAVASVGGDSTAGSTSLSPAKRMVRRMIQLPYMGYLRWIGASGYWLFAVAESGE